VWPAFGIVRPLRAAAVADHNVPGISKGNGPTSNDFRAADRAQRHRRPGERVAVAGFGCFSKASAIQLQLVRSKALGRCLLLGGNSC